MKIFLKSLSLLSALLVTQSSIAFAQRKAIYEPAPKIGPTKSRAKLDINGDLWISLAPSRPTIVQFPEETTLVQECIEGTTLVNWLPANVTDKGGKKIFSAISVTIDPKGLKGSELRKMPPMWLNCLLRNSIDETKGGWTRIGFVVDDKETHSIVEIEDLGASNEDPITDLSAFQSAAKPRKSNTLEDKSKDKKNEKFPLPMSPISKPTLVINDNDPETMSAIRKIFGEKNE